MIDQDHYALSQYQSCCDLLDVDAVHSGTKPTLHDVSRKLLAEHRDLKSKHLLLLHKTDSALLEAVKQGIAAAPDRILTEEVLGAVRLPIPCSMFAKFTQCFPKDSRCTQRGEWLLIIHP